MKGRNEAWTAQGKDGREEVSGGVIERGKEGARGEGEQEREENFKGGIPRTGGHRPVYGIFTNHSTMWPLALRLWNYKL